MNKRLKNTTESDLFHDNTGTGLPADEYHEVDEHILEKYTDDQMLDWFADGTIIFNDTITDYSTYPENWDRFRDKVIIQKDNQVVTRENIIINFEGSGIQSVVNNGNGKTTVTATSEALAGSSFQYAFVSQGALGNKWLAYHDHPSNTTVAPIPFACSLLCMTFSNKTNDRDVDIEVYKNGFSGGNKIYTWQIRDKRWAYKTDIASVNLNAGDYVALYGKKITSNTKPTDVVVELLFQITNAATGEGGGNL